MSYIRMGSPYKYLEGFSSNDYVFPTKYKGKEFIEDYGSISNETIVELLLRFGDQRDDLILTQMGIRLAENLNIKLRKKPLTDKQLSKKYFKEIKKTKKGWGLSYGY